MRILSLTYLTGIFLMGFQSAVARPDDPMAVDGVMDLREYDFKTRGPVELKGQFEFYWNQMLNPAVEGDSGEVWYVQVPGSWYALRKEQPAVTRFGFATYRLVILLPPGTDELAFSIDRVYSASAHFVNGKVMDYLGFPGVNKYQTVLGYGRPLVSQRISGDVAELLIRVSNFDNRSSGIAGGIVAGLPEQMEKTRQKQLLHAHFLMGAFLIIGFYLLGLFLVRTDQYRLYMSIICVLMAVRVALTSQVPALEYFNFNGLLSTRFEYLSIYMFAPFVLLMVRSIFPIEFPSLPFRIVMWTSVLFVALVVVSPISLFSFSIIPFFIFFLLISMLFLYVLVLAWIRGRSHAPAFVLGLGILFLGAGNDMLVEAGLVDSVIAAPYGMFLFLLVYAYIFADKTHDLKRKSDRLARELSQVRNNLEDLVEKRTTELQSVSRQLEQQKQKLEVSNRDLRDAMNARNRMFSIIGHDIRAPIGYLRQALEMIMENKRMKASERTELLGMMAGTAEITYNLLDNLLVWGRSQTGRLKSNPVVFQLKALVDESLELVNIGILEKGLKVEVFVSEEHYVRADRDQLYVVIRNLLSNAMKFTPEKGSIYISSKKQRGEMVISVRDSGIGIPEAMREKLLDAKSHISTNGTKGEKGSGLGLKISHEIAQINKGRLDIESIPGSGTTIMVTIPAATPPSG